MIIHSFSSNSFSTARIVELTNENSLRVVSMSVPWLILTPIDAQCLQHQRLNLDKMSKLTQWESFSLGVHRVLKMVSILSAFVTSFYYFSLSQSLGQLVQENLLDCAPVRRHYYLYRCCENLNHFYCVIWMRITIISFIIISIFKIFWKWGFLQRLMIKEEISVFMVIWWFLSCDRLLLFTTLPSEVEELFLIDFNGRLLMLLNSMTLSSACFEEEDYCWDSW